MQFNHGSTRINTDQKKARWFGCLSRPRSSVGRGREGSRLRSLTRTHLYYNQLHARTTMIWTAVAERSGDTAFGTFVGFRKRRGAPLPAVVRKLVVAAQAALLSQKTSASRAVFPERGLPGRSALAAGLTFGQPRDVHRVQSCCAQDGRAPFGPGASHVHP
jgi:hypothetical protein